MGFEILYSGATDVGLKRRNNEDAFILRPDLGFCAVADGMGGAAAGEVASRIFVETAAEIFSGRSSFASPGELVKSAFTTANRRVLDYVAAHPDDEGMGCTAEILSFSGESVVIGHVGDSRIYRLRKGVLKQLTHDHSLVQTQIDQGLITPQEARTHPMRNVILRAVGTKDPLELDVLTGTGLEGDVFLLCSDGLSDMIDDVEILSHLNGAGDLQRTAGSLIEAAKSAGGRDNVTVALAKLVKRTV